MKLFASFRFLLMAVMGFTLLTPGCKKDDKPITVKDVDGNEYQTVTIGSQVWMAETLRVTHYRNGDPIPDVPDSLAWGALGTGARCTNPETEAALAKCGYLYNWFAVNDPRGLAPEGWHVPSMAEWVTLIDYLGGEEVAGGKIRESGTTHWKSPNKGAANESGFNALPEGSRSENSEFMPFGYEAVWWSKTKDEGGYNNSLCAWTSYMSSSLRAGASFRIVGYTVRFLKD